jgi:hypothetical protein
MRRARLGRVSYFHFLNRLVTNAEADTHAVLEYGNFEHFPLPSKAIDDR